jgi:hypothetical protein
MNGTAKTKKWGDVPPSLIAIKKKRVSSLHLLLDSGAEPQRIIVVKSDAEAIERLKSPFRGPGWKEREVRKYHPFYVVWRPSMRHHDGNGIMPTKRNKAKSQANIIVKSRSK